VPVPARYIKGQLSYNVTRRETRWQACRHVNLT
jgi:hypothetical protein